MRKIDLLLLTIVFLTGCQRIAYPKVEAGLLDLRAWQIESSEPIPLDGDWEFYWQDFLDPKSPVPSVSKAWIRVPSQWQNADLPAEGYATYRLKILLPENHNFDLSLAINDVHTAYRMYINGKLASQAGMVGRVRSQSQVFIRSVKVRIPLSVNAKDVKEDNLNPELDIILHVSNFDHYQAGLANSFFLGTEAKIEKARLSKFTIDLIVYGALSIMALYHIGFFLYRRREVSAFYFSVFCFLMALRTVTIAERYIIDIFDFLPFSLIHKFEFLSYYFGCYITMLFIRSLYPKEFSNKIFLPFAITFVSATLMTIAFPFYYYVRILPFVQVVSLFGIGYLVKVIFSAIAEERPGAKMFLLGFVLFGITVISDVLRGMGLIYVQALATYGFLIFVIFQAAILSSRFAEAFNSAESLSENLEKKVSERTHALTEAKKEIEDISHFIHLVNSLSSLDEIFKAISRYVYINYSISGAWLFLPDKNSEFLFAHNAHSFQNLSEDQTDYLLSKKIPMKEKGGILYKVFLRKKPFYLARIPKFEYDIDREFAEKLSVVSFLQVPILRRDQCVGVLSFSNLSEKMILSAGDVRTLTNLCSQIAGAIDTNHLLAKVQKEREETESLNLLLKSLNEKLDIKTIMQKVHFYIKEKYNIGYYTLGLVDSKKQSLEVINAYLPEFLSKEEREISKKASTNIGRRLGAHDFALRSKRSFYSRRIRKSNLTVDELIFCEKMKMESILIIPLILENEPVGVLDLFNAGPLDLTKEIRVKLSILGEQLAGIIYGSKLFNDVKVKTVTLNDTLKMIQRDLSTAQKIQENTLILKSENFKQLEIFTKYVPMSEVGGDFYDVNKINDTKYRILLADATGHGVQGAMITMAIKGIHDSLKFYDLPVNEVLAIFNNEFVQRYTSLNSFLTAILIDIDIQDQTLSYASAGHPPCIIQKGDSLTLLPKTGKMIGVSRNNEYSLKTEPFQKTDRLYVFSDGIFEQFNAEKEEFGEERLYKLIKSSKELSVEASIDRVLDALHEFLHGALKEDDITILGIEIRT
jgi:transcriptional regulator with GAF, ATPase, and Fis domain